MNFNNPDREDSARTIDCELYEKQTIESQCHKILNIDEDLWIRKAGQKEEELAEDELEQSSDHRKEEAESVIFCIDVSSPMTDLCGKQVLNNMKQCKVGRTDENHLIWSESTKHTSKTVTTKIDFIKNMLNIFISSKLMMNPDNEFAILLLKSRAEWYQEFTSDVFLLQHKISALRADIKDYQDFDMSSVFSSIKHKIEWNTRCQSGSVHRSGKYLGSWSSDTYRNHSNSTIRVIFIYGRSYTAPYYSLSKEIVIEMLRNPDFYLDVIFLHGRVFSTQGCRYINDGMLFFLA